jgi:hypothetical protein
MEKEFPFERLAISRVNCGWVILLMFRLLAGSSAEDVG